MNPSNPSPRPRRFLSLAALGLLGWILFVVAERWLIPQISEVAQVLPSAYPTRFFTLLLFDLLLFPALIGTAILEVRRDPLDGKLATASILAFISVNVVFIRLVSPFLSGAFPG